VNQTADSTAVLKAVAKPPWARSATFVVDATVIAGTLPTLAFALFGVDTSGTNPPDDGKTWPLGSWDGTTAKTAASTTAIDVGPEVTVDDTGSATADDHYGVNCVLPPWIVYRYTTTGGVADDEDFTFTIAVYWSK